MSDCRSADASAVRRKRRVRWPIESLRLCVLMRHGNIAWAIVDFGRQRVDIMQRLPKSPSARSRVASCRKDRKTCCIAQKRSAFLILHHCVLGQGAKSLAGVRGGSPASAAYRAEAIGFPYPARKIRGAKQGQRKAWRACIMAMPQHSDGARTVIFPLSRAAFARSCLKKSREILEFSVWFRTVYLRIPRNGGGVRPHVPW